MIKTKKRDSQTIARMEATGVILAGGRSRRFGSPKALAPWDGKRLVEAVVENVEPHFPSTLVLVKNTEDYAFLRSTRVEVVADLFEEAHPLGGIYSALERSRTEWIFVCGCDMPFVRAELISALWQSRSSGEAVVPVWKGKRQPLCAFYSRTAMKKIGRVLKRKNIALQAMLDFLSVRFIEETELRSADPEGLSFNDIDTREDYARAKTLDRGRV